MTAKTEIQIVIFFFFDIFYIQFLSVWHLKQ